MSLKIKIIRNKKSYDYKYNKSKNDFMNNTKNNCLDIIELYDNENKIYEYKKIQTVSNHPNMKHLDTVATGKFKIKCFVDLRGFEDDAVHGIIDTKDITGQKIDENSMQWDNNNYIGRFLIHSVKYNGKDTKFAWSGACFIFAESMELTRFNGILKSLRIKPGDIIEGELLEV